MRENTDNELNAGIFRQLQTFAAAYVEFSSNEWSEVLAYFSKVEFKKNSFLIQEGQVCKYIYFINSGLLRNFYNKEGVETTRYFGCAGEFSSALTSFLTQNPSLENVQAIEDTVLLKLSFNSLQILYKTFPQWNTFMRKLLEEVYIFDTLRLEGFITKSAQERYNDLLLHQPEIIKKVPQQYIATYLGITPVSLSRIRSSILKP